MSTGGATDFERKGPVLTTKRAAEYCGMATQTLYNSISTGTEAGVDFPVFFKQGRLNVFYPVDLDAWIAGRLTLAGAA
ncbi:helix-turn-helix domain-containing protein [Microbacterium oleivorans]|uniref:DNA-binding protein n=1 Tax=Microbacterium oleivorans TaxID=273677 RepID=A0A4R5YG76_9MICO|nr:helix-turn-helix domain-containing protein [Microbacterium oleivorans]TDL43866.1 DNA-binding protein [Microbacterium oleivorans]